MMSVMLPTILAVSLRLLLQASWKGRVPGKRPLQIRLTVRRGRTPVKLQMAQVMSVPYAVIRDYFLLKADEHRASRL